MDLIEDIGPILGIAAFLGFAILALLIVLQAREVRRLREWAGRAPERALEAGEATQAVADARGETSGEDAPGFVERTRTRLAETLGPRWRELDRRSPINPAFIIAGVAVGLVGLGIATGGFGLGGDSAPVASTSPAEPGKDRSGTQEPDAEPPKPLKVAVLNATQVDDPVAPVSGVAGLADVIASQVVEPAGFRIGVRTDAPNGEEASLIMFATDADADAEELASAIEGSLGPVEYVPMTPEVADLVKGVPLVLLVGLDDSTFGQGATATTPE